MPYAFFRSFQDHLICLSLFKKSIYFFKEEKDGNDPDYKIIT